MDDKTQKERLEQELRFLKESFDAEVISKEEFEKGKDRIEKKLKVIEKAENQKTSEEPKAEEQKKEKTEDTAKAEEPKKDEFSIKKEGEKIRLKVIQETEEQENSHAHKTEEKQIAPEKPKAEIEGKKQSKLFKYAAVFVVLTLIAFFSYSFLKNDANLQGNSAQLKFADACSSNGDCRQEGKTGVCLNPGTAGAKCEFKDIQKTNVFVLNGRKDCFNCDTQRVLSIMEQWFGAISSKEIDYSTSEGRALADKFDARLLPLYIFDENITKKAAFEQFKQAFIKKNNSYVLSEDAAASTFYFKRENVPNKLDFFAIGNDDAGIKAEKNIKEFLENFKEAKFEKHLSTDPIVKELGIKAFPAFLVNNRIKFGGIQTAENIKNNFCKMNKLESCNKTLSRV